MILTALIVIGCILLFFVFVLSLKAKITVIYDGEVALYLKVLFIKIKLLPKLLCLIMLRKYQVVYSTVAVN